MFSKKIKEVVKIIREVKKLQKENTELSDVDAIVQARENLNNK